VRRAFKYRLFTNANQERELAIMLETHRRLYNACLEQRKVAYATREHSVKYAEQSAWFKAERVTNSFFARLNFSSAQATMRRLDKAFVNFFRRVKEGSNKPGYPRFKARDRFDSVEFPAHGDGIRLVGNRLRVQHVGMVRVKLHRPVEGKIKTITLKQEADKWYAIASCDLGDVKVEPSMKPAAGIDVGLTHFLTTSEGQQEPNPRYLKDALPRLRRAGRFVARKKKGGSNRRKAVRRLQKVHARVRNLRREHHHQVACRLVLAFGFIVAEALNIKGMLANGRLACAISDAGWAGFLNVLRCKAEKAGAAFVAVDPRGTSQECSRCGQEVRKDLSVRWHDCPHCGLSLDRDHNAALNILARARPARTEPAEANVGQQVKRPPRSRRFKATE
jgi:putative transposase